MFALTLAHERRHIYQARQVRNDRGFPKRTNGTRGTEELGS
jgi:hypothetical protein